MKQWSLIVYICYLAYFCLQTSCTSEVTPAQSDKQAVQAAAYESQCSLKQCPCATPMGVIKHGTAVNVYDKGLVACGESCLAITRQLTCDNGKLFPAVSDFSFTCEVADCRSCVAGINRIQHNEKFTFFSSESVACGASCEDKKGELTCNNGVLEGDKKLKYSSCQKPLCHCSTPDGLSYLSLGGKRTFYNTEEPACGHKCSEPEFSEVRVCEMNTATKELSLSGSESNSFLRCKDPTGCFCKLPNGDQVEDGEITTLTKVPFLDDCHSVCPADADTEVRCRNGDLVNEAGEVIDVVNTLYREQGKCSVRPCKSCDDGLSGGSFKDGTRKPFYKSVSPTCSSGLVCSAPTSSQLRTCDDGEWLPASSTFKYSVCHQRSCQCTAAGSNANLGANIQFYPATRLTCSQSCNNVQKLLQCQEFPDGVHVDGTAKYKYEFRYNNEPVPAGYTSSVCLPAQGCECNLPNGLGKVTDKTQTKLFSLGSSASDKNITGNTFSFKSCGNTCAQAESVDIKCDSGSLRSISTGAVINPATTNFKYLCQEAVCQNCSLTNYAKSIANNTSISLWAKQTMVCGDDVNKQSAEFSCIGGKLQKGGLPYVDDPDSPNSWYDPDPNGTTCDRCPVPWGSGPKIGKTMTFYKKSSPEAINACGSGCKSVTRTCLEGGVFSGIAAEYVDYTEAACPATLCNQEGGGAPPRLCLLPWQNSFATPDSEIPMYKKRQVGCGDSCQNHYKLGRCDMLTGKFDAGFEYIYPSCEEVCNK